MSQSRQKTLPAPGLPGKTKTLIAEHPGRVALLVENGRATPMKFSGAHAALDWAEGHRIAFYYLPPAEKSMSG
jgi:hypothetical protein